MFCLRNLDFICYLDVDVHVTMIQCPSDIVWLQHTKILCTKLARTFTTTNVCLQAFTKQSVMQSATVYTPMKHNSQILISLDLVHLPGQHTEMNKQLIISTGRDRKNSNLWGNSGPLMHAQGRCHKGAFGGDTPQIQSNFPPLQLMWGWGLSKKKLTKAS